MAKAFASLQRQSLPEQVVRQVGMSILRGEFAAGDVLAPEPELCTQLGVSRTVLREALKLLVAKGLIESRPGLGTCVQPRTDWNLLDPDIITWQAEIGGPSSYFRDVCEVRLMIEPMAARLAAVRASDAEVAAIEAWCQRMELAVNDPDGYTNADLQFHAAICLASHNELVPQLMTALHAALYASRVITSQVAGANEHAMPLHQAVARAIRKRAEQEAEDAMRALVKATLDDIVRAEQNQPPPR
jgi:GntR family galactonate operon transcriptional repressor